MVLGEGLVDKKGNHHKMPDCCRLLPVMRNQNYTWVIVSQPRCRGFPFVQGRVKMSAHEFHYSSVEGRETGEQLFEVCDALGENKSLCGIRRANVMGSFIHLIDLYKN